MERKQIILCILGLAASIALPAQNKYSLESCKQLALKNNRQVINAHLQVQASGETKKEAYTNFFPSLSASGLGFMANKGLL